VRRETQNPKQETHLPPPARHAEAIAKAQPAADKKSTCRYQNPLNIKQHENISNNDPVFTDSNGGT